MSDVRLRVSADELRKRAAQMEQQIKNVEKNWNSLCETAGASRYYWEGEAANYGRRLLEETKQDVGAALGRLRAHPANLMEMAGVYVQAEEKAAALAKSLPDHVIL